MNPEARIVRSLEAKDREMKKDPVIKFRPGAQIPAPIYAALSSILMRRLPSARHSKVFVGSELSINR